jgi:hypothetical protein
LAVGSQIEISDFTPQISVNNVNAVNPVKEIEFLGKDLK